MMETDTVPFHRIQVVNKHDSTAEDTAEDRGTKRFRCLRVQNLRIIGPIIQSALSDLGSST